MHLKAFLLASILAAALLAGCSAKTPSGTFADLAFAPKVDGGAVAHYQAFSGANPGGQVPQVGGTVQCAQPPQAPVPPCKEPFTLVKVNVTAPKAVEGKYSVFLVNATGSLLVADLSETDTGDAKTARYAGEKNFTTDYTGRFTGLELRLGGFLLATAPAGEGAQAFVVAASAKGVKVPEMSWEGHKMSGTIEGLPANATYQGNLYLPGPDGAALADPAESFTINGNGPFEYTSTSHDVGDFAEFHVHVGHSKVNLYKASVKPAAA